MMLIIPVAYADNWVCYDSSPDGSLKASEVRAKMPIQPNSPLQIIRTGSQKVPIYTTAVYFRECGEDYTFDYCPENEYFLKTVFNEVAKCTKFSGAHHQYFWNDIQAQCGLGGSPYCSRWSTSTSVADTSNVCGKNDDKWETMTASTNWDCPTCKELSIRQEGEVPVLDLSSFDMISFSDYPLIANTTVDVAFNVEVPACINRIPLVSLEASLVDSDGVVYDKEIGVYAKHTSMIYNSENVGIMEDFNLPLQEEFRKTYNLKGNLNGYRAWAWRTRLFDGINTVVDNNGLTIPGFPTDGNPARIDDLYVSSDFLGGIDVDELNIASSQTQEIKKSYAINTLEQFEKIGSRKICTVDDFKSYYYSYGINSHMDEALRDETDIDEGETIASLAFTNDDNRETNFVIRNVEIDLNELDVIDGSGTTTSTDNYWIDLDDLDLYFDEEEEDRVEDKGDFEDWIEDDDNLEILEERMHDENYLSDDLTIKRYSGIPYWTWDWDETFYISLRTSRGYTRYELLEDYLDNGFVYHEDVFGNILDEDMISDSKIVEAGMDSMSNFFSNIPDECDDYEAEYMGLSLNSQISYSKIDDETAKMTFYIDATWVNDIGMTLDVFTEKEYDIETSWQWKGLANVEPDILATCLYNWDDCMNKEVNDFGDVFYEVADCGMGPPSDLEIPTEKDAARNNKVLNQPVTVYRPCFEGDNWISKEKTYACSNGQVYKCQFSASMDEVDLVEKVLVGQKVRGYAGNDVFVCTRGGVWKPVGCDYIFS